MKRLLYFKNIVLAWALQLQFWVHARFFLHFLALGLKPEIFRSFRRNLSSLLRTFFGKVRCTHGERVLLRVFCERTKRQTLQLCHLFTYHRAARVARDADALARGCEQIPELRHALDADISAAVGRDEMRRIPKGWAIGKLI